MLYEQLLEQEEEGDGHEEREEAAAAAGVTCAQFVRLSSATPVLATALSMLCGQ